MLCDEGCGRTKSVSDPFDAEHSVPLQVVQMHHVQVAVATSKIAAFPQDQVFLDDSLSRNLVLSFLELVLTPLVLF